MRRVLVTGAGGFIGRHALPLLAESGFDIHAVSSRPQGSGPAGISWHHADLLASGAAQQLASTIRATHLLHLAWYAEAGKYWSAPENFRWVSASLELLEHFRHHGGQRAVVAGSCAEYEAGPAPLREHESPLRPSTIYGRCKHDLQTQLATYSESTGLSSAWGRVFFVYGPHERPERLVPAVASALLRGHPARCTHGEQERDFVHVRDAASAFRALLESEVSGPVNIASGQAVRVKDVALAVGERTGRRELLQFGALPAPPNDPPRLVADVARLANEVGWRPAISLADGIADTVNWWGDELRRAS